MNITKWYNQKTTRVVLVGMIGAVGAFVGDQISLKELVEAFVLGLTAVFMRQGVEKSK